MSVLCPRDVRALAPFRAPQGHLLQRCGACRGLWLPAAVVAGLLGHAPDAKALAGKGSRPAFAALCCPDDGSGMRALHHRGVEIDVCQRCGGVWLDAGELERILASEREDEDEDDWSDLGDVVEEIDFSPRRRSLDGGPRDSSAVAAKAGVAEPPPVELELAPVEPLGETGSSTVLDALTSAPVASDGGLAEAASGVGDALGAVFEFVGEALSSLSP
jgi:Zn-finger nucleic acid-binding protein